MVRGLLVRIKEGSIVDLMFAATSFASVAGMLAKGRTRTSNVALDGISAASRTSIGPETDANADVSSPGMQCMSDMLGTAW